MSDLLFEIGTEEIPAGYIEPALADMEESLHRTLTDNRLEPASIGTAGTPRRLVMWATGLPAEQPPEREEVVGPPADVAFEEDGTPGQAAQGFARSQGIPVDELQVRETDKGPYAVAVVEHEGKNSMEVLPSILKESARAVSFPKSMRWPDPRSSEGPAENTDIPFARPIRWITALFDSDPIPLELAGVSSGKTTFGHPFLAPRRLELGNASFTEYRDILERNSVIVDVDERRKMVRDQVNDLLSAHGSTHKPDGLVDEVTNLVEHPHAIEGSFEDRFLEVPDPVLCAAMISHQRYFPVRNEGGELENRFVIVSNRTAEQADTVRKGNERVLRARLDDARFFWEEDRRNSLEELVPRLEGVVFLEGLGNYLHRTRRLEDLTSRIARLIGVDGTDREAACCAARLCKADLLTELVGEFPDMQGQIGRQLALEEGLDEAVASAIAEHYRPERADEDPPATIPGTCLALADKMDLIVCCFALGYEPTGSQDPYGLRRNAVGILMTLEQHQLDGNLRRMIRAAAETLESQSEELSAENLSVPVDKVLDFFRDRLYHAAVDRGHRHDCVRAVMAAGWDREVAREAVNYNVRLFWKRLEALRECADSEVWDSLVELVDRTRRIQHDLDRDVKLNPDLLEQEEEHLVAQKLQQHSDGIEDLFEKEQYEKAARLYCSTFAEAVHDFFEEVFVNVDDPEVRDNRKALCRGVYELFAHSFADLYLVEG
ncbi:MAG: glycine--tRNA ligase subunit beta [Candidatus Brocadiia bacterium]